jgi:hypothetical protein
VKLGSSRRRESQRRRQRFWLGILNWGLLIGAVVAAGFYAWHTGSSVARREVDQLQTENTQYKSQIEKLQGQVAEAQGREAGLKQQVPPENLRKLVEMIENRVNAGMPVDRLETIVEAAKAERSCDAGPVTKRFFVQTPVYQSPGAAASFGDNAIIVTAEGSPTVNPQGKLESWYDPAQPVTVTFTESNGAQSNGPPAKGPETKGPITKAAGLLPLQRTIVVADWEYKFNITAGARGIVNVAVERCRYP